jgi:hypothetical protein
LLDLDISIAPATPMEEGGTMGILDACAARVIGHHVMAALVMSSLVDCEKEA